jgi:hypothetical protein
VSACQAAGGGIVFFPAGTYLVTSTINIAGNDTWVVGAAMQATNIKFVPTVASACFNFANGVNSMWFCGIRGLYFSSTNTTLQKTMVKITDGRQFTVEEIGSNDDTCKGATSIGIDVYGREFVRIRRCYIYADQPVRYNTNPNLSTNSLDHSAIEQSNLVVNASTNNYCVKFSGAHIVTRFVCRDVSFIRGIGALSLTSTGSAPSIGFQIKGGRHEQAVSGSTYTFDLIGTTSEIQDVQIEDFDFSGQINGVQLTKVRLFTLKRLLYGRPSGVAVKFNSGCVAGSLESVYYEAGSAIEGAGLVDGLELLNVPNGSALKVQERNLALVNGNNNEVSIPIGAKVLTVSGPTAAFTITGVHNAGGGGNTAGRSIRIVNNTSFTMTIAHDSASSAVGTRIKIGGSANLAISPNGAVDLIWVNATSCWFVTGQKA